MPRNLNREKMILTAAAVNQQIAILKTRPLFSHLFSVCLLFMLCVSFEEIRFALKTPRERAFNHGIICQHNTIIIQDI